MHNSHVTVIGGGLAGVEAAYQVARQGIPVRLFEMRPALQTSLHSTGLLGELLGSNCLAADRPDRASGLLMAELRRMGSLVMRAADATQLPLEGMLCVDAHAFAEHITTTLEQCPNVDVSRRQATDIPYEQVAIVACGPATSSPIARRLFALTGQEYHFFYGATEPLFRAESVELEHTWLQGRFGDNQPVYRNCALDAKAFECFCAVLAEAGSGLPEGVDGGQMCRRYVTMEALAADEGVRALLAGPMNPAGLGMPDAVDEPSGVCQMCPHDAEHSLLRPTNMRTGLPPEQQRRLFSTIPGLEHVEFARYGTLHRAVHVNAPMVIEPTYQLKRRPRVLLAGAIAGVDGYLAAASSGLIAGIGAARILKGKDPMAPPVRTLTGAMSHALAKASEATFKPLQVTFGILTAPDGTDGMTKEERRDRQLQESIDAVDAFIDCAGIRPAEL